MKRILITLAALALLLCALGGCTKIDQSGHGGTSAMTEESSSGDQTLGEPSPPLEDEGEETNGLYQEEGSGASVRYEDLLPAQ